MLIDLLHRSLRDGVDAEAVRDARRGSRTYFALMLSAHRLAAGLRFSGLAPGDRVAVLARNRVEYAELYFAAAYAGLVLVPLNWRLRPAELGWIIEHSGARVLVAEPDLAAALESGWDGAGALALRAIFGEPRAGWSAFHALEAGPDLSDADRTGAEDDVVVQMYTSGTTGRPKGALLTHRNLESLVLCWRAEMGLRAGDCFVQVTPLFHVGALLMLLSSVAAGARLVLLPDFDPLEVARALERERATHTLLVPSMLAWLLDEPRAAEIAFPALRRVIYGAAPIAPPLLARAMERLRCDFLQGYGLTETAGVITALRPDDHRREPELLASAGREVACSYVRVLDEEGREVAPGTVGEVCAQGPNVTPGYWRDEAATAEALRGGWLRTGDLGRMDERGYLYLVDRRKDLVIVGGENVYPREIEDVLLGHPAVRDAAVIGIPHAVWGEEVLALVVRRDGATAVAAELIQHCRARLARFKCPTKLEFRDALPRTPAGKLQKTILREPYWAGRARRV